jgi:hypothetical protein
MLDVTNATDHVFFAKPFAILRSGYEVSAWIDLDCEIRSPLKEMFASANNFAVAYAGRDVQNRESVQAGVVVARHGSLLVEEWARLCLSGWGIPGTWPTGDQFVLDQLAKAQPVTQLDQVWNWTRRMSESYQAKIMHYVGSGKKILRERLQGTRAVKVNH